MALIHEEKGLKNLADLRHKEGEDLAQILSQRYGIPYMDIGTSMIDTGVIKLVDEKTARAAEVVCFLEDKRTVSVGILTPKNEKSQQVIIDLERKGYTVLPYLVSKDSLAQAWETYKESSNSVAETGGVITISDETLSKYLSAIKATVDIKGLIEQAITSGDKHAMSTVTEIVLAGAVAVGVSDIHMEAEKEVARLRYRIDGILQEIYAFKLADYKRVLSRIKLQAGVKLNVAREAQDGRFTIKLQGIDVEVRASFLPSSYMEGVVLRILNPKSISVPMEELGMDEHLYEIMKDMIERPNGLILTTGPTGSGKTTTLYAFLKKVRDPQTKIITIEDPIEYHLDGISQTQVDNKGTGYRFSDGLRAAMRQDPDVIMVGEIRDEETASVAIDSALTGHLVLSTLHTNSAAGAIPRLIDLGINPKIIGSSVNIMLAQRLVRRLCPLCKEQYTPEGKEKEAMERLLPEIVEIRPETQYAGQLYRPVGCDKCTLTGYKGRLSIYEGIVMDAAIDEVIRVNASERDIKAAAKPQRILDMRQDGIVKCIKGITSLEEVSRIIGLENLR